VRLLRVALVLAAITSVSLLVVGQEALGKAGSKCPKAGQERSFSGVAYVCVALGTTKKGGRKVANLIWQRSGASVAVATTTTTTTFAPSTIELGHWRLHKKGSAAAQRQTCEVAAAKSVLSDGTKVVCVDKFGDKRWALAPDAISVASHDRVVAWLKQTLPTLPAHTRPIEWRIEPSYRRVDADIIQQIVEGTKGFFATYEGNLAFVLAMTGNYFYDSARELLGSRYDNASASARAEWEFKWRKSKMQSLAGGGHASLSSDQELIIMKATYMSSAPEIPTKRVVEDFVREYLGNVPTLDIKYHVDSGKARQCWLMESSAWLWTFAVMEHFKVPGFDFSEQWAFWVSELAGYESTYRFGLEASETAESVATGNPRYDMPCQLAPGVGHIQGMLAREILHSKADMSKYEAFVASDQSRQSFTSSFGFSYDNWVSESDTRTRSLLSHYNKGVTFVPIESLSPTPRNAKEAEALEDVAIVLRDLTATSSSSALDSAHEFFVAWEAARDRSQSGSRKVWEIGRDPLGLKASLVWGANSKGCVLIVYDSLAKRVSTYPAGVLTNFENSIVAIPPNRRCD